MENVTLELEVLTPAFVSGADQSTVEIRSATVRGLLRWWWRALHPTRNVKELAHEEGALFGSQGLKIKSPLRVTVNATGDRLPVVPLGHPGPTSGVGYTYVRNGKKGSADILPYLAYGPVRLLARKERDRYRGDRTSPFTDNRGEPKRGALFIRPAVAPGARFGVELAWRNGTLSQDQVLSVVEAAAAWVTLGGMGTRSRKGFGALEGKVAGGSSDDLMRSCRKAWDETRETLLRLRPPQDPRELSRFTSLKGATVHVLQPADSWQQALGEAGLVYKNHRPKGRFRWIGGDAQPRRASAILLSVIRDNGKYRGVVTLLPATKDGTSEGEPEMREFMEEFCQWGG